MAARRLGDLRKVGLVLAGFGVALPMIPGVPGVVLGKAVGLSPGGAMLLGVLAGAEVAPPLERAQFTAGFR